MPIGSYTGDYLHLSDENLLEMLGSGKSQPITTYHDRIEADIKQVILWRLKGDPRGWPANTPSV